MAWFPDLRRRSARGKSARKIRKPMGRGRLPDRLTEVSQNRILSHDFVAFAVVALVWLCATLSVTFRRPAPPIHYVDGQRADRFIYSEVKFQYRDSAKTAKRREQALRGEPPIYRISDIAIQSTSVGTMELAEALGGAGNEVDVGEELDEVTRSARTVRILNSLSPEQLVSLRKLFGSNDCRKCLLRLLRDKLERGVAERSELAALRVDSSLDLVSVLTTSPDGGAARVSKVLVNELEAPEEASNSIISEYLARFPEDKGATRSALTVFLAELLLPSLVYDSEATDRARAAAAEAIGDVYTTIPVNAALLVPGQSITPEDIVRLEKHQEALFCRPSNQSILASRIVEPILCLLLVVAVAYCLCRFREASCQNRSEMILFGLVAILQLVLLRTVTNLYSLKSGSSFFLFSLLPLSFAGAVLSPLVGMRAAICVSGFTALVGALQQNPAQAFELLLLGLTSSLVAISQMRRVTKRAQALRAGFLISLSVFALELLFLMKRDLSAAVAGRVVATFAVHALVNGMGVALAVYTVLPLLEYWFGMVTQQSLLELSDLNHPLLKRLQLEAPGTFHHCHLVATLADHAAESIGANGLLARVCAYFHDIGKLAHPEYFIENSHGENPHDDLQPRLSSLVILNHVKEGMVLAGQYKLKPVIREAISQHHGTSLVGFFYHKAMKQMKQSNENGQTLEQEYRYPGPRPVRKEIALVGLADACEAGVRSLEKPTAGKIRSLVHDIVLGRVRDHQLDKADLTFAELSQAEESLVSTLSMMFHGRVKYPKEYEDEARVGQTAKKASPEEQTRAGESAVSGDGNDGR
ncbi:MAG: HDIG domain-containing protein [Lentisphaeria bacterium]|nr:HDIG domain-containing protein [Lentisphaeria bacterium]